VRVCCAVPVPAAHGAPVAATGVTCASRSQGDPAAYQTCVNNWVDDQRIAQYGAQPGSTCGSRPPPYQQSCFNEYIEANLQPAGVTDACGAAPDKQACLNGLVDARMTEQQAAAGAGAGAGAPVPQGQAGGRRLLSVVSWA
jgi:hypothetical protein